MSNTPGVTLDETTHERIARLARQRIGSREGIHLKTLSAQNIAEAKRPKTRFVLKPINKDKTS